MTVHVFDSSAMIAYLVGEPGGLAVKGLLVDPRSKCYAHSVNLCEVYYDTYRSLGEESARRGISTLLSDGVVERKDMSRAFWEQVGSLKTRGRISLADCFGIALAQKLKCAFVTSDHHELDRLVPLGIVQIRFIR